MWRSVWRTTPAWVETWNSIFPPAPWTTSVEPPPMSTTTSGVVSAGSRSLVAPAKVSSASVSPSMVRASKPKRSRTACVNSAPFSASRTALVSTPIRVSAPSSSASRR